MDLLHVAPTQLHVDIVVGRENGVAAAPGRPQDDPFMNHATLATVDQHVTFQGQVVQSVPHDAHCTASSRRLGHDLHSKLTASTARGAATPSRRAESFLRGEALATWTRFARQRPGFRFGYLDAGRATILWPVRASQLANPESCVRDVRSEER